MGQGTGEVIGNELKHSWNQTCCKCLLANTQRQSLLPSCLINLGSIFIFLGAETVVLEHLGRVADWVCSLSCQPESWEGPPTVHYTEGQLVKTLPVATSPELFRGGYAIAYSDMFMPVQDITVNLKGTCQSALQEEHCTEYQNHGNNPAYLTRLSQAGLR